MASGFGDLVTVVAIGSEGVDRTRVMLLSGRWVATGTCGCRLENETLDRDIGVDVVVAEEGDHLAPRDFLDGRDEVPAHGVLVGLAHVEHDRRRAD